MIAVACAVPYGPVYAGHYAAAPVYSYGYATRTYAAAPIAAPIVTKTYAAPVYGGHYGYAAPALIGGYGAYPYGGYGKVYG